MKKIISILLLLPFTLLGQNTSDEERIYLYDNLNRLEKVVFHNGLTYTYSYDNLGNRQGIATTVEIEEEDFELSYQNINGCEEASITIHVEKRNNYHVVLTNITTEVVTEIDFITEEYTFENLELGEYSICITINNIPISLFQLCLPNVNIIDVTDVSHITEEDFHASVYGIFNSAGGKVTVFSYDEVECHNFNLEVTNEAGTVIYNDILNNEDFVENNTKGIFNFCVTIENISSEVFEYCFTVGMFRNDPQEYDYVAFNECNVGIISYRLPDDGYEYLMEVEDGNHDETLYQSNGSGANGYHDYLVEMNTDYFACLSMSNVDYSSRFCNRVNTYDPEPISVNYDIDYQNKTVHILARHGIPPYEVYVNNDLFTFEGNAVNEYFDLNDGMNTISIFPYNSCENNFNLEIFIPSEYSLFPNPTNGILNIHIPTDTLNDKKQVEVVDMLGRKVLTQLFNNIPVIELNVSHLSNATYIINIYDETDGFLWQSKFIKE